MTKKSNEETICFCNNIAKEEIIAAISSGANTLQEIREITDAATGNKCKTKNPTGKCCAIEIRKLLNTPNESTDCNCSCGLC